MTLNVVMLGPPGAGKGTQALRLASNRGIPKISTGDIFRTAIADATPLGLQAKATLERGGLMPDDIVNGIVRERLARSDARLGVVLDGFPRTVNQARALDEMIEERTATPLIVVNIVVPEHDLVERLARRRICAQCGADAEWPDPAGMPTTRCSACASPLVQRPDDQPHVVRARLKVYQRDTRPLIEYYRHRLTFRLVNGAQPPDRVQQEILSVIDSPAMHALRPVAPRECVTRGSDRESHTESTGR